jgi:tetratricopeptide (TPR) repeat protein
MLTATFLCASLAISVPVPDKRHDVESPSWVGKTVIVIGTRVEIGNLDEGGQLTPPMTPLDGIDYRVYGERGNFVQLKTRESISGWIEKRHIVPIENAVFFFTKKLEQDPADLAALNHRGWAWSLRGEYLAGIKDLDEAVRRSPDTTFYNNRARIWGMKGEHDRALTDYNIAIDLGPQFYLPHFNRGGCWLAKKDYDKAMADFDRALQLKPNFTAAYRSRGNAWLAKRNYDKAIADFNEALRLDPKFDSAYHGRGNAWRGQKDYDKALSDYNEARRLDLKNGFYIQAIAWLLATAADAKVRDGKRAVELAKEALALERSEGTIMDTLAAAYAEAGNFAEAVRWQERALEDPRIRDDADVRRRLELYRKKQAYRQE